MNDRTITPKDVQKQMRARYNNRETQLEKKCIEQVFQNKSVLSLFIKQPGFYENGWVDNTMSVKGDPEQNLAAVNQALEIALKVLNVSMF